MDWQRRAQSCGPRTTFLRRRASHRRDHRDTGATAQLIPAMCHSRPMLSCTANLRAETFWECQQHEKKMNFFLSVPFTQTLLVCAAIFTRIWAAQNGRVARSQHDFHCGATPTKKYPKCLFHYQITELFFLRNFQRSREEKTLFSWWGFENARKLFFCSERKGERESGKDAEKLRPQLTVDLSEREIWKGWKSSQIVWN